MIAILHMLAFIVCVFVAGALLAWPLSLLLGPDTIPLHKLAGHGTVLSGLIGAFIFLALNGALNRSGLGYHVPATRFLRNVMAGLIGGGILLLIIEVMLLALDLHTVEPELSWSAGFIAKTLLLALLTGLIVGIIEETIFRGAIITVLVKHNGMITAILVSSLVYALVHFVKFPALPAGEEVQWFSGLTLLANAFNLNFLGRSYDVLLTLFLLGVILAQLRFYTGNIALSIGVHAGLVMMMKITRELTDYLPGSRFEFLINDIDRQLGLLSALALLLISIILFIVFRTDTSKMFND